MSAPSQGYEGHVKSQVYKNFVKVLLIKGVILSTVSSIKIYWRIFQSFIFL